MWAERIAQDVRAQQESVRIARMFGSKAEWPSLTDRLEAFEAWLESEPVPLDPVDAELREALGLRGHSG